jgi:hypothetical protein
MYGEVVFVFCYSEPFVSGKILYAVEAELSGWVFPDHQNLILTREIINFYRSLCTWTFKTIHRKSPVHSHRFNEIHCIAIEVSHHNKSHKLLWLSWGYNFVESRRSPSVNNKYAYSSLGFLQVDLYVSFYTKQMENAISYQHESWKAEPAKNGQNTLVRIWSSVLPKTAFGRMGAGAQPEANPLELVLKRIGPENAF